MKKIPLKVGSIAQNNAYTGARGEVTVVVDIATGIRGLRVHDGATMGGTDMARSSEVGGGGGGGGGGGSEESPYVYATDLPLILADYVLSSALGGIIDEAVTEAIDTALTSLPLPASVADQAAGVNLSRFVTPGRQSAHASAFKAWAYFSLRGIPVGGHDYYEPYSNISTRLASISFSRSGNVFTCTAGVPHNLSNGSIVHLFHVSTSNTNRIATVTPTDGYSFTFQADPTNWGTTGNLYVETILYSSYNFSGLVKNGEGKGIFTLGGYTMPAPTYTGGPPRVGFVCSAQGDYLIPTSGLGAVVTEINPSQQIHLTTGQPGSIPTTSNRTFAAGIPLDAGLGFLGVVSTV